MTRFPLCFSLLLAFAASGTARAAAIATPPARLAFDFNAANPWPDAAAVASAHPLVATFAWQPVGTIDVAGTATASGGLLLTVDAAKAPAAWESFVVSGPLTVAPGETDLGKLTLGFMLSASAPLPVMVRIESLDAASQRTGGLEGMVYPAAADFYQRYSLDLSTLKPFGEGKFDPAASSVRLSFGIARTADGRGWPAARHELRVDNVSYSGPAFYVRPNGKDTNDGRTEATAFATPQAAVDAAQPGDIILLGEGTYHCGTARVPTASNAGLAPVADFHRSGTPAAWIVLKNYPGQKPLLTGNAWSIVNMKLGSNEEGPETVNTLAYLEIRGLHVRGEADLVWQKFPELIGQAAPQTNTNGISIEGRFMTHIPHHIRVADCLVEYCSGQGIGEIEGDRIIFENNLSRCNSWQTIYGTSGISTLGASNFDTVDNVYKNLVRNNVAYRNETYVVCRNDKRMTDGNGIILDVNQATDAHKDRNYIGRTLVTGNLCYDNGGGGIHCVRADRIDIINNTTWLNSASRALQYSQIDTYSSKDVRIINNILVAPVADVSKGEKPEPVNKLSGPANKDVVFEHNLYFGGNIPPNLGKGDAIGDPMFIHPSRDAAVADFRLKPGSPAVDGATTNAPALPSLDLAGRPRPEGKGYDLGACELSSRP